MVFGFHRLQLCALFMALIYQCVAYRHVIMMHGLLGNPSEFEFIEAMLAKHHPNTTVTKITLYIDDASLTNPMWKQVDDIRVVMDTVMKQHPEGVHLLCYSQGGLVCRGVIETLPTHNVINLVSLSSPQGGQFGDTSSLSPWVPSFTRRVAYELFYTELGQDHLSIANYWKDPYHIDLYHKYSNYLAVLNNESTSHQDHQYSNEWKKNFSRVKNLVLIGGPDDDVITPWQSAHFGFYDKNDSYVINMTQQKWYQEDSFGLKSLDQAGKIHMFTVPGITHKVWPKNATVISKYILPWLD